MQQITAVRIRDAVSPVAGLWLVGFLVGIGFPVGLYAAGVSPTGTLITGLPDLVRAVPQREAYEVFDPPIGRHFDLKQFWVRADLRIRPEWRNGVCFGGGAPIGGACNRLDQTGSGTRANTGRGANDFYVQQWARLGIGYDLSPDVNFYLEVIDSSNWGSNGNPNDAGQQGDPLTHSCGVSAGVAHCRLGVRAAYALIRNFQGVPGLSLKIGRQYVVFGNQRLFGHFDWANTGYSHDGVMVQYSGRLGDSYVGWFRSAETDLAQAAPLGSLTGNVAGCLDGAGANPPTNSNCAGTPDAGGDVNWFLVYNQIKAVPGFLIEPYYMLYLNELAETANAAQGLGTPKHSAQRRHMIGGRLEMRKGNWDILHETAYQFGRMADGVGRDNRRTLRINAWATGTWLGYTAYEHRWKPRTAVGFDYASGDGDANCVTPGGTVARLCGGTATTFENFFPTNFLHVGFLLNGAWRNMMQAQVNVQARPTARDHVELWVQRKHLASARDNWYRGSQGPLVFSRADNTINHVGDEVDLAWTHLWGDGKISFTASYGHFFPGPYVAHHLGTSAGQDWAIAQVWMNF